MGSDLLDKLKKEERVENNSLKIETKPILKDLIDGLYKAVNSKDYEKYYSYISDLKYTAKDIEDFSIMMPIVDDKDFHLNAGIFLNMLINDCKEKEIILYLYGKELTALGAHNYGKNIILHGNAGYCTGYCMNSGLLTINGNAKTVGNMIKDGKIIVKGNTEDWTGCNMDNGEIIIEGNADDYVGERMGNGIITIRGNVGSKLGKEMKNGKIIVYGDAGKEIGAYMSGGCIELHGNYSSIDKSCRGAIYHQGKLILDNGNPINNANIKWA